MQIPIKGRGQITSTAGGQILMKFFLRVAYQQGHLDRSACQEVTWAGSYRREWWTGR